METITVGELQKFDSSTTSAITKRVLTGVLTLVTGEEYDEERGTFLFVDVVHCTYLPCQLDFFVPQLLNSTVFISQWVFLDTPDYYLEFSHTHIFKDPACTQSCVMESLQQSNERLDACIQNQISFHEPSLFLTRHLPTPANLTGVVSAISILFVRPDSPASFFLDLASSNGDHTVTTSILFHGDCFIQYYAYFCIGAAYMFQQLTLSTVQRHAVFAFDERSSCDLIPLERLQHDILISSSTTASESRSEGASLFVAERRVVPNSTYTGKITRVVDSLFGIYELDNKVLVCLFHYLGYSPCTPYRTDSVLKLSHVHVAYVHSKTSHLLDTLWHAPAYKTGYMMLVACVKSHVDVTRLSANIDLAPSVYPKIRQFVYTDSLARHCTFSRLLRQLEIYATLVVKCQMKDDEAFQYAYTAIRDVMFRPNRSQTRDFFNDFINHETLCVAVGRGLTDNTFPVMLDSYPWVDRVPWDVALDDTKLPGMLENRFEQGFVQTQVATYDLTQGFCIVGYLKTSGDGRLFLADATSRVRLTVLGNTFKQCRVGGLYMVRKCKYMKENATSYLSVQQDDLLPLHAPETCFQSPTRASMYKLSEQPKERSLVAMHVVDKYPVEMAYDHRGRVYFSSRLVVRLSGIGHPVDTDKQYVVVLSSTRKSLKWSQEVDVGSDWVLEHVSIADKIHLDGDQHVLYPLVIGRSEHGIQLDPVGQWTIKERKVYGVADIVLPNRCPEIQVKTGYNMYEQAVCVQGVVVQKRLVDGFKQFGERARRLYDELGVGTGQSNQYVLIQLREMEALDTIQIYMHVDHVHYPLGVVVGSVIRIRHLLRKQKSGGGGQYGLVNQSSLIEVLSTDSVGVLHEQETRTIASFLDPVLGLNSSESEEIFKFFVYVQTIISLRLKWVCEQCRSVVNRDDCVGLCGGAHRIFMANAYVEVSDGTSSALVSVDGERLVFGLLQLTTKQQDALKLICTKYGEMTYSRDFTEETQEKVRDKLDGFTIRDLCDKAKAASQFWLFGKHMVSKNIPKRSLELEEDGSSYKRMKTDTFKELKLRKVSMYDNKQVFETVETKKLELKAVDLDFPEARLVAYDLLKHL